MSVHEAVDASGWDRWRWLTEPYNQMLDDIGVTVLSGPPPGGWPAGEDRECTAVLLLTPEPRRFSFLFFANPDVTGLEREYTVRGLLAAHHGVDTSDWPTPMDLLGMGER